MAFNQNGDFEHIYMLVRRGRLSDAIRSLLDENSLLRAKFRGNANHGYYLAGDILYRKRSYAQAKDAFRRAVKAWGSDIEALQAIGNCYDKMNRPRMAERALRKAVGYIDAGVVKCRRSVGLGVRLNLANALLDQKKYAEAASLYASLVGAPGAVGAKARKNLKLAQAKLR